MSRILTLNSILSLTGTSLATSYTASSPINIGNTRCVRFWVKSLRTAGSGATTTTIKLQARYNDGSVTTSYLDLPSHLDDSVGAAQPNGSTFEIEHAFSTPANATTSNSFVLDRPEALLDVTVNLKVNSAGQTTDNTTVYASAFID
jgi:hypothetical protein